MKIAFLIPTGLERPAGVRYSQIARGLVTLGHDVTILALHPDFARCSQRRFRWQGVNVWYVGQMHARKVGDHPSRFGPLALLRVVMRSTAAMAAAALRLHVDGFHLGKPQPINGLAGLIASRARGLPLYVDCDDYEAGSNRFGYGWQRQIFAWWEDRLPALAQGVTVNTHFLGERVQGLGARQVVYVPNGIDRARFQPLPPFQRAALRRGIGVGERPLVGYIGSLSLNNHPVDLLLHAFARLLNHVEAHLLIVGGGEDSAALRELSQQLGIADYVRFAGHVSLAAVPGFMSLCDVTVDPVNDDDVARARCPLKLIESLALGVPMVTGDVGDRRELLAEGAAGLLVEPGSADALADGLAELLTHPQQLKAKSRTAVSHAAHYDWQVLARQWARVYTKYN